MNMYCLEKGFKNDVGNGQWVPEKDVRENIDQ